MNCSILLFVFVYTAYSTAAVALQNFTQDCALSCRLLLLLYRVLLLYLAVEYYCCPSHWSITGRPRCVCECRIRSGVHIAYCTRTPQYTWYTCAWTALHVAGTTADFTADLPSWRPLPAHDDSTAHHGRRHKEAKKSTSKQTNSYYGYLVAVAVRHWLADLMQNTRCTVSITHVI